MFKDKLKLSDRTKKYRWSQSVERLKSNKSTRITSQDQTYEPETPARTLKQTKT